MSSPSKSTGNLLVRQGERILDSEGQDVLELADRAGYSVSKVADGLGMTVREFEGALERCLGIRPKVLFRNHRAVAARRLMQEGMDLKEIADRLGFRHYTHFAAEMKGFYGIPPVQLQTVVRNRCDGLGSN
ncbi:helix-turn-helix domain-containing protein [Verrucomicrobiaceae bacterium 227]